MQWSVFKNFNALLHAEVENFKYNLAHVFPSSLQNSSLVPPLNSKLLNCTVTWSEYCINFSLFLSKIPLSILPEKPNLGASVLPFWRVLLLPSLETFPNNILLKTLYTKTTQLNLENLFPIFPTKNSLFEFLQLNLISIYYILKFLHCEISAVSFLQLCSDHSFYLIFIKPFPPHVGSICLHSRVKYSICCSLSLERRRGSCVNWFMYLLRAIILELLSYCATLPHAEGNFTPSLLSVRIGA